MSKPTYYELLKQPEWQRKRLEIMQRDGFQCVDCGNSKAVLNVHHVRYYKGRAPWDYADELLLTLCEKCHTREFELNERITDAFNLPLDGVSKSFLLGAVKAIRMKAAIEHNGDRLYLIGQIDDAEIAAGIGYVFGMTVEQVRELIRERMVGIDQHGLLRVSDAQLDVVKSAREAK